MIDKLKIHQNKFLTLMIVSFIVTYLGGQDAITATMLYNKLDLKKVIYLKIDDKYNKKKDGESFPDLNFKGKILTSGEEKEIKVSKGDFDNHKVGQIIKVFKTNSNDFITEYEIDNQGIIHIKDRGFSIVFIPTTIFFMIGIFSLVVILKNEK